MINIKIGQTYQQSMLFKENIPYIWKVIKVYEKPKKFYFRSWEFTSYGQIQRQHDNHIEELDNVFFCFLKEIHMTNIPFHTVTTYYYDVHSYTDSWITFKSPSSPFRTWVGTEGKVFTVKLNGTPFTFEIEAVDLEGRRLKVREV